MCQAWGAMHGCCDYQFLAQEVGSGGWGMVGGADMYPTAPEQLCKPPGTWGVGGAINVPTPLVLWHMWLKASASLWEWVLAMGSVALGSRLRGGWCGQARPSGGWLLSVLQLLFSLWVDLWEVN